MLLLGLAVLAVAASAQQAAEAETATEERFPIVEPLGDGVWAALQPAARRFSDSNSVVVDLGGELLLVDTQADGEATDRLLDWIDATLDLPVRWLVNTHWHVDHVAGNERVVARHPGVTIVAHDTLEQDVPGRAADLLAEDADRLAAAIEDARAKLGRGEGLDGSALDAAGRERLAAQIAAAEERERALRETSLTAPSLLYTERLTLPAGDGAAPRVELLHFAAHTDGDTILWLPGPGILITGDVVDALPYGGHGHPRQWLATLDRLAELAPRVLAPGHGPVYREQIAEAGQDAQPEESEPGAGEQLERLRRLFADILAAVDEELSAGGSLESLRAGLLERPEMKALRALLSVDEAGERAFDDFVPATAERAWEEATAPEAESHAQGDPDADGR